MNLKEYLLFAIEHKCNSKCGICFIEGIDDTGAGVQKVSMPSFKKYLSAIPEGKYRGVIFSGGEVTLNEQLPEYASYARDKGFSCIMIQTNARALSDLRRAKQLKSAGINQFFVSFHSADHHLSDLITGRTGAHAQTVKGLENLEALGLAVITNTVMTSMNYSVLPEVGEYLTKFSNIAEMHFWGYMPLTLKAPELILPYVLAAPYLNRTIKHLLSRHKEVCVKFFPVCLLDDLHKQYHNNYQPATIGPIINIMNERFESCGYQNYPCCEGTDCKGVPEIYKSTMPMEYWIPPIAAQ